jgi:hypothetical protein
MADCPAVIRNRRESGNSSDSSKLMKMRWLALSTFLFLASTAVSQTTEYDRYGGWSRVRGSRTGFFHVERSDGRWWFVTPEGNGFLSNGVDHINWHTERPGSPPVPPADPAEWARDTARQLREWNFNTAASWAEPEFANAGIVYAPVLDLAGAADPDDLWRRSHRWSGSPLDNARRALPHSRNSSELDQASARAQKCGRVGLLFVILAAPLCVRTTLGVPAPNQPLGPVYK